MTLSPSLTHMEFQSFATPFTSGQAHRQPIPDIAAHSNQPRMLLEFDTVKLAYSARRSSQSRFPRHFYVNVYTYIRQATGSMSQLGMTFQMFQRGSSLYQFLELASEHSFSRYINRESQQLNELLQGLSINNLWVCVCVYIYIIRYTCKHYVYIIVNL